ncbi:MAG TPA: substrate-binding domain-containing protein [Terriglobales bacterium]|nr:substrate-binding domain-containing protein [Terriglobales bacterium]
MKKQRRGIHLIAHLADVSIGTVDRALHGRDGINEATRARILKIAQQIGYTPNLAARALSVGRADLKIGVCVPREIRLFYDELWSGILDEAQRVAQLGIHFLHRPVHALGDQDTQAFTELVAGGVAGIILTAGTPDALKPLIDKAEDGGIRVVCVSTDSPQSRRSSIVCVEPWLNGHLAGELMGKFVPPGSSVAVVAGMLRTEDHHKKTDGFSAAFPQFCAGGRVVDVIEGHEDEDESFQKTFELLHRFPALAGLYVNTVNCLPVCRALGARGLIGKVKLITTDLFAEMEPYFKKGTIAASIYQQPHRQGQLAVRLLADNLVHKVPLPSPVHLTPAVVMSSNLHLFREIKLGTPKLDESAFLSPVAASHD